MSVGALCRRLVSPSLRMPKQVIDVAESKSDRRIMSGSAHFRLCLRAGAPSFNRICLLGAVPRVRLEREEIWGTAAYGGFGRD